MQGPNNGYPRVTFKYDFNGLRTEKVYQADPNSQPQVTKYHYLGSKLTYVEDGSNRIYITYSPGGTPLLLTINGTTYFYLVNAQGDVLGLVDGDGNLVVEYEYDSWGKPVQAATELARLNPLRYRSYVYDDETGLYYLQSRYYQPEWGRFINADEILTGDLYEYCKGNPVNYVDPNGHMPLAVWGAIGGAIIGGIYNLLFYLDHTDNPTVKGMIKAFLKGAIAGGLIGALSTLPGAWRSGLWYAVLSVIAKVGDNIRLGKPNRPKDLIIAAIAGWSGGVLTKPIAKMIPKYSGHIEFMGAFTTAYIGGW